MYQVNPEAVIAKLSKKVAEETRDRAMAEALAEQMQQSNQALAAEITELRQLLEAKPAVEELASEDDSAPDRLPG